MDAAEELDIVIVGAGICGLATALALRTKGIKSVILERSDTLRASGAAIAILTNGWRALDQLGIGPQLRRTALPLQGRGEARWVKRSDLIEMLAEDLPHGTIRLGCQLLSVELDPFTNFPTLQLRDGRILKAKILIGCDGASSKVAEFLGIKSNKLFPACAMRGLTYYPSPHGFAPEFVRTHGNNVVCGRSTMTENLVFWFLLLPGYHDRDSDIFNDPEQIKQMALEKTNCFPKETKEMIKGCDMTTISLTYLWYRPAWDILLGTLRKGTVTVAGDSMHVMGPFIGQGGLAAMEDSIALARCLAHKIHGETGLEGNYGLRKEVEEAIDMYVKERRMRLVRLSARTYVTGLMLSTPSMKMKLLLFALIIVLFQDPLRHTSYNCGHL
ncbi:hypothetical protein TIFTF001_035455 [Ficus carica]|uniref:FAD-binding domain-containing protein n=1 Tax=Ficus carica TaxID=3494 RepID=A0AA88EAK8_FICCA|nr:hypothetical protein TIFTF001_035455 [Ficus carica]